MSARVGKFSFIVFAMLFGTLLCNMFLMQPSDGRHRALSVEPGMSLALSAHKQARNGKAAASTDAGPDLVILNANDKVETTRAIQRELATLGYVPGPDDGTPGLMTRAAIMAFEFDNGLSLNAHADPDLLKVLLLGLPPQLASRDKKAGMVAGSEARRVVATVQQTLQKLGYHVGKSDGEFGIETERAIRDFESDQDMRETGRVSGRLVARLVQLADGGRLAMSN